MKKTFVLLTLFICFFLSFATCKPAWAKLDTCWSFVIWQLTGIESMGKTSKDYKYHPDLIKLLEKRGYRKFEYKKKIELKRGDVLTAAGSHCGIVLKNGFIAHFRGTYMYRKDLDEFSITKFLYDVDTKMLENKLYPAQYIRDAEELWKKKKYRPKKIQMLSDKLDKAITEKVRNGSIGFYHPDDTFSDFKKIASGPKKAINIYVWKQPKEIPKK